MPRGKNYVNQNKGMRLQRPSGSNVPQQECKYGAACTRSDCIYRHPTGKQQQQSADPCMAYLAGLCSFTGKTCRKRHPPDDECEKLLRKYSLRPCRFGDQCRTEGCLYNHEPKPIVVARPAGVLPSKAGIGGNGATLSSFMPRNNLPSSNLRPIAGSWQPAPPTSQRQTPQMQAPGMHNKSSSSYYEQPTTQPPSYYGQAPSYYGQAPTHYGQAPLHGTSMNAQPFVPNQAQPPYMSNDTTWAPLNANEQDPQQSDSGVNSSNRNL